MIPVVVISLIRASERREHINASLEALGIPFRFFDAIDGKTMSPPEVAALAPLERYAGQHGRPFNAGEIGCAASFRAVLQQIESGKDEFVCVAEDDAEFSAASKGFLEEERLNALPKFDVFRLHNDHMNGTSGLAHRAASLDAFSVFAPVKPRLMSTAQVFSRAGAAKILKEISPLRAPFDNLIYRDSLITGLRVLEIRPAVVDNRPMESTISVRQKKDPTIQSTLERKGFMLLRNVRSAVNFTKAWGFRALFRLRYYR